MVTLRAGPHATTFAPKRLIKTGRRRNARGNIARHVLNARALHFLRRVRRLQQQAALGITTITTMCTPNLPFSVRRRRTYVTVFVLRNKIKPGRRNAHGQIVRRVRNAMVSHNICPCKDISCKSHLIGSSMTTHIAPIRTWGHGSHEA